MGFFTKLNRRNVGVVLIAATLAPPSWARATPPRLPHWTGWPAIGAPPPKDNPSRNSGCRPVASFWSAWGALTPRIAPPALNSCVSPAWMACSITSRSPAGTPTHFARTGGGENWVRFENPQHDFPQRIEYRRDGDQLHAAVAGPGNNVEEQVIRLDYRPCETPARNSTDAEAIKAVRAASNQAIANHDTEAIVSFLDQEYVITTGAGSIEPGREAQLAMWAEHINQYPDVVYVRSPTDVTLSETHSRAIENGAWVGTWTAENEPQEKGGRYTAYWRKVDGVWKIRSELFVTLYCGGVDC